MRRLCRDQFDYNTGMLERGCRSWNPKESENAAGRRLKNIAASDADRKNKKRQGYSWHMRAYRLVLLHSYPDTVHGFPSHETSAHSLVYASRQCLSIMDGQIARFARFDGENYNVGVIEKGNTHIIAVMIAEETGADLFKIATASPYPDTYDECTDVAKQEQSVYFTSCACNS